MPLFDPDTNLPTYWTPDDGTTELPGHIGGPYPVFDAIVPGDTVTLRWRWGFAPNETDHRDYTFAAPPEAEAHIWVQTGAPPMWALFAPKTGGGQWIWRPGPGWYESVSPGVDDFTDQAPGGCDWGAVTQIQPGAPGTPPPEMPYTPSVLNAQEGGWGVVRLGAH